jgi:heme/copper-type cytochrome/quinol oxidase subunit 2
MTEGSEDAKLDTNSLILWAIGAVMIAIGVPLFYLARYLRAPENEKQRKARGLMIIALIWMIAGIVIYLAVLIRTIYR